MQQRATYKAIKNRSNVQHNAIDTYCKFEHTESDTQQPPNPLPPPEPPLVPLQQPRQKPRSILNAAIGTRGIFGIVDTRIEQKDQQLLKPLPPPESPPMPQTQPWPGTGNRNSMSMLQQQNTPNQKNASCASQNQRCHPPKQPPFIAGRVSTEVRF